MLKAGLAMTLAVVFSVPALAGGGAGVDAARNKLRSDRAALEQSMQQLRAARENVHARREQIREDRQALRSARAAGRPHR